MLDFIYTLSEKKKEERKIKDIIYLRLPQPHDQIGHMNSRNSQYIQYRPDKIRPNMITSCWMGVYRVMPAWLGNFIGRTGLDDP